MRRLLGYLIVAAIFWSAWWLLGANLMQAGLSFWLDERRAEGWVAEAAAIEVTGYPADFDVAFGGLELADPETGLAWSAPSFRLISRAWNPANVTAIWPTEQVLATPEERITIRATGMEAALVLVPGPALTLISASAGLDEAGLDSSLGWSVRVARARLSAARAEGEGHRLDLGFEAARIEPSAEVLALLDREGRLPRSIDLVSVDATIGFDAPWDRYAIERRRPQPVSIDLRRLKAGWGQLDFEAAGDLVVDAEGVPTGQIQVRAVNWRELIALATASELITAEIAGTLETGLGLLAAASGNPETIELPLNFRGGTMSLGPIPLGPAPILRLR